MIGHNGIRWRAPATMIGALLLGCLLALDHHLFYLSLDQKPVSTEHLRMLGSSYGISHQRINTSAGTAFAFLTHSFLVTAVATAYWQVVWRTLRRQAVTLSTIDTIFSVLRSASSLLSLQVLWKRPLLLLLVTTSW